MTNNDESEIKVGYLGAFVLILLYIASHWMAVWSFTYINDRVIVLEMARLSREIIIGGLI